MAKRIIQFPTRHAPMDDAEQTSTNPDDGVMIPVPDDLHSDMPGAEFDAAMAASVVAAGAILSIAHGLVKRGWSHHCTAKNARNGTCPPDDPDATAWSVDGAIWLAAKQWRDEVKRQNGGADQGEQPLQKGGALHRHHSGPRCPEEILALETVLEAVGLPVNHNCRETVGMWNRSPEREAYDASKALDKARESLKKKTDIALSVLQPDS